jgi:hypothetical protein
MGLVPGAVADIVIGAPNDLVRASGRDSGNERAPRKADGRRANGRTGNGGAAAVPAAATIIMIDHRRAMEATGINSAGVPAIESRKDPIDCRGFLKGIQGNEWLARVLTQAAVVFREIRRSNTAQTG